MKTLLILLFSFISLNLFAQDWDDERHEKKHHREKYKKDYFTLGLYTGSYIGKVPLQAANGYVNSITAELEYFTLKNLSIAVRYTYGFTKLELYDLKGIYEGPEVKFNEPDTRRENLSLIGKYYLGSKKFRPYLQLGINQEFNYIGNYSINFYSTNSVYTDNFRSFLITRYSVNLGVGINIKLSKDFSLDMNYDIYKALSKNYGYNYFYGENSDLKNGFNGNSSFVGIKYNL